jgi:uncharacterized membrane protein YeaQ/YmgE (transglycosylase-associated protein family)
MIGASRGDAGTPGAFPAPRLTLDGMVLYLLVALIVLLVVLPLAGVALWMLISTVVTGLIIGALGRLVIPGRQPIGLLPTMLLGIAGSMVGNLLGAILHAGGLVTLLLQIAVAAAAVAVYSGGHRSLPGPGRRQISARRF